MTVAAPAAILVDVTTDVGRRQLVARSQRDLSRQLAATAPLDGDAGLARTLASLVWTHRGRLDLETPRVSVRYVDTLVRRATEPTASTSGHLAQGHGERTGTASASTTTPRSGTHGHTEGGSGGARPGGGSREELSSAPLFGGYDDAADADDHAENL